jgi:hypothetical protein
MPSEHGGARWSGGRWPGVLAVAVQGRRRQQLAAPSARRFVATELIGRDVPSADARVYAPADSCCWG